jgi:hypothetical protein
MIIDLPSAQVDCENRLTLQMVPSPLYVQRHYGLIRQM